MNSSAGFRLLLVWLSLFAVGIRAAEYTVTIPTGTSMLANHLNRGSNTVSELLPNVPGGMLLYKFDADRQIHTVNQYSDLDNSWTRPHETLAPGEGAMIEHVGSAFSVTFSGTAPTNTSLPPLVGGYNWVSFPSAEVQDWPPALDGDVIHRWDGSSFSHFVYDSLEGGWLPSLPSMSKGEAFVYYRAAPLSTNAVKDGTIYFNNRVLGKVDAPVSMPDGSGPWPDVTTELVLVSGATFTPLRPQTTFRQNIPAFQHYVNPVVVTVPGRLPGEHVSILMRAYIGTSYAEAHFKMQSGSIAVNLGGGGLNPPALLRGLQGFTHLGMMPPRILSQPQSVTASLGADVRLGVELNYRLYNPPYILRAQWEKNGALLTGQTNEVLEIHGIQQSDAGNYRVRIYTDGWFSEYSSPATVSILGIDLYPGLTLTGPVGARYRIEYSLEAEQPTWHPLSEITLPSSPYTFADVTAPARAKRFYRAVLIPPD